MKTRPEVDFSSPLCQPYEVRQGEHGVLLMHGFAGSAAHMRPLAEGLVQQGFGVRTINLPGHATTLEDMRRCSWQDWLNAAKEAFREMKEQYRFVSVTGLSMGGCLTLMIAEQSDPTAIAPISAPMGVLNRWFPLARFAAPFLPEISWQARKDDALTPDYDLGYTGFPTKSAVDLRRIIHEARNNLCAVTCPVLCVQSSGDQVITPDSADVILQGGAKQNEGRAALGERAACVYHQPGRGSHCTGAGNILPKSGRFRAYISEKPLKVRKCTLHSGFFFRLDLTNAAFENLHSSSRIHFVQKNKTKNVFMFIGDGMGNPQVTATQYYLGSIENPDSKFPVPADLSFTKFPYLGLVTTYDSSSFCPDSASTATLMASGKKTLSGGYTPFFMAVSHIMNNKAGLSYTSYAHTGLQIPVYAYGVGAEKFSGLYDNTGIFTRTMDAMGLTADAE